jgi:tetratricopeptide (TPR) repeat protein
MTRLSQLQELLSDNPGDSFVRFALAKEYEKLGDEARAFTYYRELLEKDPDYLGLYYHLGKWYERADDVEQAINIYSRGMDVARQQGDQHALGELSGARMMLADG